MTRTSTKATNGRIRGPHLLLALVLMAATTMPAAAALLPALPPVTDPVAENHGLEALYFADLGDCIGIAVYGTYVSGNGDEQTWDFDVYGICGQGLLDECTGYGSIEAGFSGDCVNQEWLWLEGTHHYHAYPNCDDDVHEPIDIIWGDWYFPDGVVYVPSDCDDKKQ